MATSNRGLRSPVVARRIWAGHSLLTAALAVWGLAGRDGHTLVVALLNQVSAQCGFFGWKNPPWNPKMRQLRAVVVTGAFVTAWAVAAFLVRAWVG